MAENEPDKKVFELGLVMAGAVSAGAYTAGVLDYLIQALDAWSDEKAAGGGAADLPPHDVRLTVLTGSSAGGMCSALGAIALGETFEHATGPAGPPPKNRLYKAWVEMIDLEPLLTTTDLTGPGRGELPPRSALNGDILDAILRESLTAPAKVRPRAYVGNEDGRLQVVLTTTNLRGVPYHMPFQGGGAVTPHYMSMHADHVHFEVSATDPAPTPAPTPAAAAAATAGDARDGRGFDLNLRDLKPDSAGWKLFAETALATGAFPVGLPPRRVGLPENVYGHRRWRGPTRWRAGADGSEELAGEWRHIPPDFPPDDPDFGYLAVDGGATDNEPIELARAIMGTNRTRGAAGGIVMIDPFPDSTNPAASADAARFRDFAYKYKGEGGGEVVEHLSPLRVAQRIVRALVNQSRFKPAEIARAQNPLDFEQFLIAPSRDGRAAGQTHIACGALGGFSGFLDEGFRKHDYHLGRHNCQSFLRKYFALPLYPDPARPDRNPLFADWTAGAIRKHLLVRERVADGRGGTTLGRLVPEATAADLIDWSDPAAPVARDPAGYAILLPVIPLRGVAAAPVEEPPHWPTLPAGAKYGSRDRLRAEIKGRMRAVLGRMIENLDGFVIKQALYYVRWRKTGRWTNDLLGGAVDALKKEELVPATW